MADSLGTQLTELVTQMKSTINEHFMPALENMKQTFTDEMKEVEDWADDVEDAIEQVGIRIGDAFDELQEKLAAQVAATKSEADDCLEQIGNYQDQVSQTEEAVSGLVETANQHGSDLDGGLNETDDLTSSVQDSLSDRLDEWMDEIQTTLASIEENGGEVVGHFANLGEQFGEHVQQLGGRIGESIDTVTSHVGDTLENLTGGLEQLVGNQTENLVSNIAEALGGDVGGFIGTIGEFVSAGEEMSGIFDGGIGDILGSVEEVGKVIDGIKPVIDLAEALF